MSVVINSNPTSLMAQRHLSSTQASLTRSLAKLSSGLRIESAADDAAGLAISERLRAQVKGLAQAERNANDAISMVQVAEGAMNEQAGILTRLRELGVQSATGTLTDDERAFIDAERGQLVDELDRISAVTEFNGIAMLGADAGTIGMQVGINATADDQIDVTFAATDSTSLGVNAIDLSTAAGATAALTAIDTAITNLSTSRTTLGASQNRLSVAVQNLAVAHENLTAADSRIRDVDVARETSAMTRSQILSQAGTAVLAQANQLPGLAMQLLG